MLSQNWAWACAQFLLHWCCWYLGALAQGIISEEYKSSSFLPNISFMTSTSGPIYHLWRAQEQLFVALAWPQNIHICCYAARHGQPVIFAMLAVHWMDCPRITQHAWECPTTGILGVKHWGRSRVSALECLTAGILGVSRICKDCPPTCFNFW